jgi:hypothetical protein
VRAGLVEDDILIDAVQRRLGKRYTGPPA